MLPPDATVLYRLADLQVRGVALISGGARGGRLRPRHLDQRTDDQAVDRPVGERGDQALLNQTAAALRTVDDPVPEELLALAQPVWDSLYASQEREIGERIVMTTGLGMTESGPFGIFVTNPNVRAGDLGVPTPGLELKLVDMQGKTEVRYRGPNITPGYWRAPQETAEAFDEELDGEGELRERLAGDRAQRLVVRDASLERAEALVEHGRIDAELLRKRVVLRTDLGEAFVMLLCRTSMHIDAIYDGRSS